MNFTIAVLPGDGIGPEVVREAIKILRAIEKTFSFKFECREALVGGAALEATGTSLPEQTLKLCKSSHAVLLGAIGGPQWDHNPPELRPEQALLRLRKALGNFANLRPAKIFPALKDASPLKPTIVADVDLLIVRELTGGIYFGEPRGVRRHANSHEETAFNTETYSTSEIERIARVAFDAARRRKKRVTSVDKANVLESSQLWRRVVTRVAKDYPDVEFQSMYVDNCAMQLIADPRQFDVILTNNLFGDILSDEAAMLTGSIGLLPSASFGGPVALYEPVHGSAPDLAGKNQANPIATILSAGMMLEHSFQMPDARLAIECAVSAVLDHGFRTQDLIGTRPLESATPLRKVSCSEMGDAMVVHLLSL